MSPARKTLCVLLLGVLSGVVAPGAPAQAAPVPGNVLTSSTATLPPELTPLATAKKVQYVTTNLNGGTITATGLILTPKTGRTNKTVVWAHGTTGLADKCAPSNSQDVFWPEARAAIAKLLAKGWTVAAPDYPGLGTVQQHPYLIGASEARSIIDSVKAARNLDAALSTHYAIDGHSQGGQGGLFAGQIAPAYDGALVLKGVAAIAPANSLDQLAPLIPGTPGQGYLVMALHGIAAVEPSFVPGNYLTPGARLRSGVLLTGCLYEILDRFSGLTAEQLVPGGQVSPVVVSKLGQYGNPGKQPTTAPVLVVQGDLDEAVPAVFTDGLVEQLDGYSQPVDYVQLAGQTHDGAVFASTDTVANWIAARFT